MMPAPMTTARSRLSRHGPLVAVCVVLVLVALVRLRVADLPLERDEGEYAYAGQLILQGIPPYRLAYNMKFPGTYYAYAAILAVFGQTAWGIHVGLLVVNAATALVLFFLGRRLLGGFAAAIAAAAFCVLTLDIWIMGVFAHATHFVLLPAVGGFLVLARAMASARLPGFVLAGVLLGLAVLMKQHAFVYVPLALGLVAWGGLRRTPPDVQATVLRGALVLVGAILPFAVLCAVLAAQGVLERFWFWTFQYASQYVSRMSLSVGWTLFTSTLALITSATLPMWLLAALGAVMLWATRWAADTRVFITGLLVASFIAVCPGFYFREHYFIVLLPAVALLVGVALVSIERLLARAVSPAGARAAVVALFVVGVGVYALIEQRSLGLSPRELSRQRNGTNPFVEAVEIGRYLREHTSPDDRIAVVGSEPEIYFYANRKSATGYIYTYPLMEPHRYASRMQDEMIREIDAAHPRYVVFVGMRVSLSLWPNPERRMLDWVERYVRRCYTLTGLADVYSLSRTNMRWDTDVADYKPRSNNLVFTFRRTSDAPCTVER
jgi:4-amino-4-deoxy-L-arabinose transferase-like glycosyltransferase